MIEMQNMDGTDMIPDLRYRFFDENNDVLLYNIFHAELVIRHSENKKLYLYDIINIKKETSTPLEP